MDIYARLGSSPLLSRKKEKEIARRLRRLEKELRRRRRRREALRSGRRGAAERRRLNRAIRALEDDVRREQNILIEANLRLVISIAKRYFHSHFELSDLVQEGGVGLMRMVARYDPGAGCRFSTYATWWIRQSISRAISDKARTIRIPVHVLELIARMHRFSDSYRQRHGREPEVRDYSRRLRVRCDKIRLALALMQVTLSLSDTARERPEDLAEKLEDHDSPSPWDTVCETFRNEALARAIARLSAREAGILRLRYGLDAPRTHTLREVGRRFNVSRERIRQIECEALDKLRDPRINNGLQDYYQA
ncbi:MAG: sigma-70 family RNA polymerase sigma factor [Elusimicrobiota bacterium]